MSQSTPTSTDPVVEFEEVVANSSIGRPPISLSLKRGDLVYLPIESIAMEALGIQSPVQGTIRFLGKKWDDREIAELEIARQSCRFVINPVSENSKIWLTNLDIGGNIRLSARFDAGTNEAEIELGVEKWSAAFGLSDNVQRTRSASIVPADSVRAQWVRAFLCKNLSFLVLENPLQGVPSRFHGAFAESLRVVIESGTAVLWAGEEEPPFAKLDLQPMFSPVLNAD